MSTLGSENKRVHRPDVSVKALLKFKNRIFILELQDKSFDFPGGRVEYGEKLLEALKRELQEELSIHIEEQLILFDVWNYISKEKRRHSIFIYYIVELAEMPKISLRKGVKGLWLTKRDFIKRKIILEHMFLENIFHWKAPQKENLNTRNYWDSAYQREMRIGADFSQKIINENRKVDSSLNIQFEIEHRARFSKEEYTRLQSFLEKNAKDLGQDDKNVYFFTFPDKVLKVTENVSKNTAKITGKLNKIGENSSFEEIEFPISTEDVSKAVLLFQKFGFTKVHNSFQKRRNFLYHDVEIALKYSETWGHHAEFEIMIENEKKKTEADNKIIDVAKELHIALMTEEELKLFIQEKESEVHKS